MVGGCGSKTFSGKADRLHSEQVLPSLGGVSQMMAELTQGLNRNRWAEE